MYHIPLGVLMYCVDICKNSKIISIYKWYNKLLWNQSLSSQVSQRNSDQRKFFLFLEDNLKQLFWLPRISFISGKHSFVTASRRLTWSNPCFRFYYSFKPYPISLRFFFKKTSDQCLCENAGAIFISLEGVTMSCVHAS